MKGKIFPESSNIFQDQAKILFNYYQQMAEKIVNEEERLEKEIAKLEEEKSVLNQDLAKAKLWKWVLAIFIIPFIYFLIQENGLIKQISALDERINEFKKLHKEIFRDYKVSKLGVAYVPIADQIKYENSSFIVDYTGMVNESEVKLQVSRQNDLLIKTISDLENLATKAPIVESSLEIEEIETDQYSRSMQQINQHDYFGKLERSLRTVSYCMDDLDVTSVSLPLVANNSSFLEFLKEYSASEVPETSPIFEVFDTQKHQDDIAKFQKLNQLKDSLSRHTIQFEDVLKGLMQTMANSVQAISALKIASTDKIVFESNKVLYKILKSPYNHYSPVLEAAEIERIKNENFNYAEAVADYVPFQLKESSKVRYNLLSDSWSAEDGSTTNFPFGVHQIHEEIVAPIVQNLMKETRIERLKIYNHIKDQKISYLNKWHQDTEDFYGRNRAESADLINLMRASLRDYVAAYNTLSSLKKTEDSMAQSKGSLDSTVVSAVGNSAEVFAAFETQSKEFQNVQTEFETYMERLKEDIDLKAEKFEHIDYYDALLRDGNSRDTAVASSEVHDLDERRKPLISVNPLFAKVSEIPPAPHIEAITYKHIALNLPSIAKNTLRELDEDFVFVPTPQHFTQEEIHELIQSKEELDKLSDAQIAAILVEYGFEPMDKFDRNEAIAIILNANNDSEVYTEEELQALSDSEIENILDEFGFEPMEKFDRNEAIATILKAQEEDEDEYELYTEEELKALSDSEIEKILLDLDFEPMEVFDKEDAIATILNAQLEDTEENEETEDTTRYTEEELRELTDAELQEILENLGFEPMEEFDREEAIETILNAQEEDEENQNN